MPRKLSRMKRFLTTGGIAVAALAATPAVASADDCEYGPITRAFAQFGDSADYYLAPGGDFESLTWRASPGATLVSGNEPFGLAPGSRSLRLRSGDWVTSPELCVSRDTPHLRYVSKGSGALSVDVRMWAPGRTTSSSIGRWSSGSDWAPSRIVNLWTSGLGEGETALATVTFRSGGDWLVDDVFVDPYRR